MHIQDVTIFKLHLIQDVQTWHFFFIIQLYSTGSFLSWYATALTEKKSLRPNCADSLLSFSLFLSWTYKWGGKLCHSHRNSLAWHLHPVHHAIPLLYPNLANELVLLVITAMLCYCVLCSYFMICWLSYRHAQAQHVNLTLIQFYWIQMLM